jgi:hypothetical protein
MHNVLIALLSAILAGFRTRFALQVEIVAFGHPPKHETICGREECMGFVTPPLKQGPRTCGLAEFSMAESSPRSPRRT